jgi:ABC-type transporter Mla subunit MlaD
MGEHHESAPHPRSKLEYLYRDLLIECDRIATDQRALANQIETLTHSLTGAAPLLRQASASVATQAGNEAKRAIEQAAAALASADQRLQRTHQSLHRASAQNARYVGVIAALCGLVGGLLGALVMATLLAP